ncbi:MAG: DMT family transporter [Rhodocyclaceae bacterium]|nr:DMT family transporter [Rhodocyclaceae bacterium]
MRTLSFIVLGVAVLVVSTAALLVRVEQAEQVSSISIAFWRLTIASFSLVLYVACKPKHRAELFKVEGRSFGLMVLSGLFLAIHFATWIGSLAFTSVASSTALVSTNPVWLALFSWLVLKDRPDRWIWVGVAASLLGSTLIFLADSATMLVPAANTTLGNGLALVGSITVCGYLLIGRSLAHSVPILLYVTIVFSSAAVTLFVIAVSSGAPLLGYSATAWLCLLALAFGPQLIGHSGISWSLRHLAPTMVAVVILGEPVCSALLAWWCLGEQFGWLQVAGFLLILTGISVAAKSRTTN